MITVVGRFQFQTGAIKSWANASMHYVHVCFNSKLVRLKVNRLLDEINRFFVSIPNWCD